MRTLQTPKRAAPRDDRGTQWLTDGVVLSARDHMHYAQTEVQKYALYGVLAVFFISIVLPRLTGGKPDTLRDTLETSVTIVTLVTSLAPKRKTANSQAAAPHPSFHLSPSFMSGWYGGIIGGAIAGLITAPAYYFAAGRSYAGSWPELISMVFGFAVMAGFFLGATSQLGAELASHLAAAAVVPAFVANEAVGGLLGGAVGGVFAGAYGGWIFGPKPVPVVSPVLLVFSGTVAALTVCGGALLYNYRGQPKSLARVFFISLIPTLCGAMIGFFALESLDLGDHYFRWFDPPLRNLEGGAYMGAIVGATLGLQIGCTLLFYRLSNKAAIAHPGV